MDGSTFRRLDFSPQLPAIPRNVARVPMSANPLIEQSPNNDNRTNFRAATSVPSVCSVVQFPFVGGPAFRDTQARWTRSDQLGPARTRSFWFPRPHPAPSRLSDLRERSLPAAAGGWSGSSARAEKEHVQGRSGLIFPRD